MSRYRLRTQQFCALSKEQLFQSWLYTVASDLYADLLKHLSESRSCRDNGIKMTEISGKLDQRKVMPQMIQFLKREYPHTVEAIPEPTTQVMLTSPIIQISVTTEVFAHYKPALLSFPQKAVMENADHDVLRRDVLSFLTGKVAHDYIIIGNRAYIEYFKLKYAREAEMIKVSNREIFQYRAKHGLAQSVHYIPASNL